MKSLFIEGYLGLAQSLTRHSCALVQGFEAEGQYPLLFCVDQLSGYCNLNL